MFYPILILRHIVYKSNNLPLPLKRQHAKRPPIPSNHQKLLTATNQLQVDRIDDVSLHLGQLPIPQYHTRHLLYRVVRGEMVDH